MNNGSSAIVIEVGPSWEIFRSSRLGITDRRIDLLYSLSR